MLVNAVLCLFTELLSAPYILCLLLYLYHLCFSPITYVLTLDCCLHKPSSKLSISELFQIALLLEQIQSFLSSRRVSVSFCLRSRCAFPSNKKAGESSLLLFKSLPPRAKANLYMRGRVMICFRSILYTMMHFGRRASAGHVRNNGCHNCPVRLINLPTPPNQSVSPPPKTPVIF